MSDFPISSSPEFIRAVAYKDTFLKLRELGLDYIDHHQYDIHQYITKKYSLENTTGISDAIDTGITWAMSEYKSYIESI